jgi:hypothetical protein
VIDLVNMVMPQHCSVMVEGEKCWLAPSYVISVKSGEVEYMIAVVCDDHRSALEVRLLKMQEANRIPRGIINFEPVKPVVTDCVIASNEDYIELDQNYVK